MKRAPRKYAPTVLAMSTKTNCAWRATRSDPPTQCVELYVHHLGATRTSSWLRIPGMQDAAAYEERFRFDGKAFRMFPG